MSVLAKFIQLQPAARDGFLTILEGWFPWLSLEVCFFMGVWRIAAAREMDRYQHVQFHCCFRISPSMWCLVLLAGTKLFLCYLIGPKSLKVILESRAIYNAWNLFCTFQQFGERVYTLAQSQDLAGLWTDRKANGDIKHITLKDGRAWGGKVREWSGSTCITMHRYMYLNFWKELAH